MQSCLGAPMKTAKEMAKKILFVSQRENRAGRLENIESFVTLIEPLLTAFAEERVREEKKSYFDKFTLAETITDQIKKACTEALEEAAKVAEAEIEAWDKVENFERVQQCQIIAECIRALKDKP